MAATASIRDQISELSDDLLAHILSFTPAKEAASTAVLSRRWRSLWLQSGALNLDTRSYDHAYGPSDGDDISPVSAAFLAAESRIPDKRRAFSYGARQALDALRTHHAAARPIAAPPLRRITVTAAELTYRRCVDFVTDVLPEVLRLPAASRLEELRVACIPNPRPYSVQATEASRGRMYQLCPGSLSCARTLRVLELTDCMLGLPPSPPPPIPLPPLPPLHHNNYILRPHYMPPPPLHHFRPPILPPAHLVPRPPPPPPPKLAVLPPTGFPSLTSLHLHCCKLALDDLQAMILDSPRLASLRLEKVRFDGLCGHPSTSSIHLHCQTATNLLLVFDTNCYFTIFELDMPQLRSFRYAGLLAEEASVSLKSPMPHLKRVDLDLEHVNHGARFWRFLASIRHCKSLKLNCSYIKNMLISPYEEAKLLPVLANLDRLEVKATFRHGDHMDVATFLSYLLRCCPIISELKITLAVTPIPVHSKRNSKAALNRDQKARLALFKRSVNKFRMHSSFPRTNCFAKNDDNDVQNFPDLPGWKDYPFSCLQNSLSKLIVDIEQQDCFGIQLTRFFVENSLLLKEVYIGDGDQDLRTHINYKVAKWRAHSSWENPLMKQELKVYDQREREVPSYVCNARKYSSTFEARPVKRQKITSR